MKVRNMYKDNFNKLWRHIMPRFQRKDRHLSILLKTKEAKLNTIPYTVTKEVIHTCL